MRGFVAKIFGTATWGRYMLRYRRLMTFLRGPKTPTWSEDEGYRLSTGSTEHPDLPGGGTNVEVRLPDGSRWGATLYTPEDVRAILEDWRRADGRSGLYFWAPGVILIRDLDHDSIVALVDDLMSEGEFEKAFVRLGSA
jgi:hypothetical protein